MNPKLKIFFIAVLCLLLFLYFQSGKEINNTVDNNQQDNASSSHQQKTSKSISTLSKTDNTQNVIAENQTKVKDNVDTELLEGVNRKFHDNPKIQIAWMKRGRDTLLKNLPDIDSANFRKIYYNRSFTGRPTTCGEVQLTKDNEVISDYQRFIYIGVETTYLESNVQNFDIFWDKMCVQFLSPE